MATTHSTPMLDDPRVQTQRTAYSVGTGVATAALLALTGTADGGYAVGAGLAAGVLTNMFMQNKTETQTSHKHYQYSGIHPFQIPIPPNRRLLPSHSPIAIYGGGRTSTI